LYSEEIKFVRVFINATPLSPHFNLLNIAQQKGAILGLQSISWDLHGKDLAAMLEKNKLQIQYCSSVNELFCVSSSNNAAMTSSANQE
jgi:hypothetical protein